MPYFKTTEDAPLIYAFESPTGADIEPGEVFRASGSWYHPRRNCRFIKQAIDEEYDAYMADKADESVEEQPEPTGEGDSAPEDFEARVRSLEWGDIRSLAADVETATGAEPDGGKKDDLVGFIVAHEAQAEPLVDQYE